MAAASESDEHGGTDPASRRDVETMFHGINAALILLRDPAVRDAMLVE